MEQLIKEVLAKKEARGVEALEALMLTKTSSNDPWGGEPEM